MAVNKKKHLKQDTPDSLLKVSVPKVEENKVILPFALLVSISKIKEREYLAIDSNLKEYQICLDRSSCTEIGKIWQKCINCGNSSKNRVNTILKHRSILAVFFCCSSCPRDAQNYPLILSGSQALGRLSVDCSKESPSGHYGDGNFGWQDGQKIYYLSPARELVAFAWTDIEQQVFDRPSQLKVDGQPMAMRFRQPSVGYLMSKQGQLYVVRKAAPLLLRILQTDQTETTWLTFDILKTVKHNLIASGECQSAKTSFLSLHRKRGETLYVRPLREQDPVVKLVEVTTLTSVAFLCRV